ncbi:MAG: hypothetical protein AAGA48_23890 [Myxococcota bacterium]
MSTSLVRGVIPVVLCALAIGCEEPRSPEFGGSYAIHYTQQTPDTFNSVIATVSDIDAGTEVRKGGSIEVPGFLGLLATPDIPNTFFVALADAPEIIRYEIGESGDLSETGRLSYAGLGANEGNFMLNPNYFAEATRAYMVVPSALKVAIWNPESMTIEGEISLDGLTAPDATLTPRLIDAQVDRGRLVIPTGYSREDFTYEPLGRLAVVDVDNETVAYSERDDCGYFTLSVRDQRDRLYFISHPGQGARFAGDSAGDPGFPPCMVRMESGADGFDPDYYLDMTTLTADGRPTASVVQATDGNAYVTVHPDGPSAFTPKNWVDLRFSADWEVHIFEPGNELETFEKLSGPPATADQIFGGLVELESDRGRLVETPYVSLSTADFAETTIYDVSDPDNWVAGITLPGYVYTVLRFR